MKSWKKDCINVGIAMAKIINVGNGMDRFSFHFNATSRIKSEQATIDRAPPIFGMIAADFCSALHVGSDMTSFRWYC